MQNSRIATIDRELNCIMSAKYGNDNCSECEMAFIKVFQIVGPDTWKPHVPNVMLL